MELDSSIHLVVPLEIRLGCAVNNKIATVLNRIDFHFRGRAWLNFVLHVWPELTFLDSDPASYLIVQKSHL